MEYPDIPKTFIEEGCQEEELLWMEFWKYLDIPCKNQIAFIGGSLYVIHEKELYCLCTLLKTKHTVEQRVLLKASKSWEWFCRGTPFMDSMKSPIESIKANLCVYVLKSNKQIFTGSTGISISMGHILDISEITKLHGNIVDVYPSNFGFLAITLDTGRKIKYYVNTRQTELMKNDPFQMCSNISKMKCPEDSLLIAHSPDKQTQAMFEIYNSGATIINLWKSYSPIIGTKKAFANTTGGTNHQIKNLQELPIHQVLDFNIKEVTKCFKTVINKLLVLHTDRTLHYYTLAINKDKKKASVEELALPECVRTGIRDIAQNTDCVQLCRYETITEYFVRLLNNEMYMLTITVSNGTGKYMKTPYIRKIDFAKN